MLQLSKVSHVIQARGEELRLLDDVSLSVPPGHLLAIVGPSGCGKSTLLKTIAGIHEQTEGDLIWDGRDLAEEEDLHPGELGYVPQFSLAHELLTVEEAIASAISLRVRHRNAEEFDLRLEHALDATGLTDLADRRVSVLSGGQKRRLGLALELVTNPSLLLCDEVTSGLDPLSEEQIVKLLHELSRENARRIVINVTHSLSNLEIYDSVIVMKQGRITYHGPPDTLAFYFSVDRPEDIYLRLGQRPAEQWHESWIKHRPSYYQEFGFPPLDGSRAAAGSEQAPAHSGGNDDIDLPTADDADGQKTVFHKRKVQVFDGEEDVATEKEARKKKRREQPTFAQLPGAIAQTWELVKRRWVIFFRDSAQIWLHLAMLAGFPLLVVVFAWDGIKPMSALSQRQDANVVEEVTRRTEHLVEQLSTGGLVSGLIMLQVVLVTLMASNTAAREIAAERALLEREKLGGLRPTAYVLSKILFLGVFILAQSLWMGLFVETMTGGLPGALEVKLALLVLASAAMTFVCLAISALMRTAEKATLLSIYLVGFQLPLSGAVLTLPKVIEGWVQPFIVSFWSWSGSLFSMRNTAFYDAVKKVTETDLVPDSRAMFVLGVHIMVGLIVTWIGVNHSQWESD